MKLGMVWVGLLDLFEGGNAGGTGQSEGVLDSLVSVVEYRRQKLRRSLVGKSVKVEFIHADRIVLHASKLVPWVEEKSNHQTFSLSQSNTIQPY